MSTAQDKASLHSAFNRSWRILSAKGQVDEFDSAEYRRVLDTWVKAGRPRSVRQFILFHANTSPEVRS